jgi:glycosyltransferase involved in cell wall biosynthesis
LTVDVLHVIARMNVGGTARYVGELVENIPNSLLATGYVQGAEIEDAVVGKLPIQRIDNLGRKISLKNDFLAWLELRKLVKFTNPKIIHTHTFKAGLIGRLVPGNHKKVHTFHGHLFEDSSFSKIEKRAIKIVERFLAKKTDILISVGLKVGEEIRRLGIGSKKEWVSIAPGVTALPKIDKKNARKNLGLKENEFYFGWMARMSEVKDPFLFLDIARNMPECNFVVAGGGEMLEAVKERAPRNVAVIGWADASVFWSAVDCAISTSLNEGMPIALIEAQLAGVPVIATNVGSNSEVVSDQVTGLITQRDISDLVRAANLIFDNPVIQSKFSLQAKEWSGIEFSLQKMVESHMGIYDKL